MKVSKLTPMYLAYTNTNKNKKKSLKTGNENPPPPIPHCPVPMDFHFFPTLPQNKIRVNTTRLGIEISRVGGSGK